MTDTIRKLAEKALDRKITNKEWTNEERQRWKQFFHAKNYSSKGKIKDG